MDLLHVCMVRVHEWKPPACQTGEEDMGVPLQCTIHMAQGVTPIVYPGGILHANLY